MFGGTCPLHVPVLSPASCAGPMHNPMGGTSMYSIVTVRSEFIRAVTSLVDKKCPMIISSRYIAVVGKCENKHGIFSSVLNTVGVTS